MAEYNLLFKSLTLLLLVLLLQPQFLRTEDDVEATLPTTESPADTTLPDPPGEPSNVYLTVAEYVTDNMTVNWSNPDPDEGPVESFNVSWTDAYAMKRWKSQAADETATQYSEVIDNLAPGAFYDVTVMSVGPGGAAGKTVSNNTYPAMPENIRNAFRNTTTLNIAWNSQEHTHHYLVSIDPKVTGMPDVNVTETTCLFTGLTPGYNYNITVSAVSGYKTGESATHSDGTEPEQPGEITLITQTTDSLVITWDQPYGVSHYEVEVFPDEGDVEVSHSAGETWVAHITGLTVAGGLYDIIVTPYNGKHQGLNQTTDEITVPPTPEISVEVEGTNEMTVTLTVSGNFSITSYNLTYWSEEDEDNRTLGHLTNESSHSFDVSGLTPGTNYTFLGYALSGDVESDAAVDYDGTEPEQPVNITLSSRTTDSLVITWDQPYDVSHYDVEVLPDEGTVVFQSDEGPWKAEITNLEVAGGLYDITVTPYNGEHSGLNRTTQQITVPPTPEITVTVEGTNEMNVTLIVSGIFDISAYRLHYWSGPEDNTTDDHLTDGPSYSFNVSGLTPGTNYTFLGLSLSGVVESEAATGADTTNVTMPGDIQIIENTEKYEIVVQWATADGYFDKFDLSCVGNDAIEYNDEIWNNGTENYTSTCSSLTAGALYTVSVKTLLVNPPRESGAITVKAVTVPRDPKILDVKSVAIDKVELTLEYQSNRSIAQCTNYEVHWELLGEDDTDSGTEQFDCEEGIETVVTVENLLDDGWYNFTVTIVSNHTESEDDGLIQESDTAADAEGYTLPQPVTNIRATGDGYDAYFMYVEWDTPTRRHNIHTYILTVKNESAECILEATLTRNDSRILLLVNQLIDDCRTENGMFNSSASTVGHEVTQLHPYTWYDFTVIAHNPGGESNSSMESIRTDEARSGPVRNLMPNTTSSSIALTWEPPLESHGNITHYKVCWWAERDDCNRDCEADVTENCQNVTTESWRRDDMCSYRHFDFDVSAWNSKGYGTIASQPAMTLDDEPDEPGNISVKDVGPREFNITWDVGGCEAGDTTYTVYVVDYEDGTLFETTVSGFDSNTATVSDDGMTPYWGYNISIEASTVVDSKTGYAENLTWTAMTNPGLVQSASAFSTSDKDNICHTMNVEWVEPTEREKHGIIKYYNICPKAEEDCTTVGGDVFSTTMEVDPNNVEYVFDVSATTSEGHPGKELETNEGNAELSGTCSPLTPENEGRDAVFDPRECTDCDKTKQFVVHMNRSFILDTTNGAIIHSGIIVAEVKDGGITGEDGESEEVRDFVDLNEMNDQYVTWKKADSGDVMQAYRATPDDWKPSETRHLRSRRSDSPLEELIGGDEDACKDQADDVYCNGFVKGNREYRVSLFTCTAGGCIATAYSERHYIAEKPTDVGLIVGLSVGLCLALLIAIILLLGFIQYRNDRWPFGESDEDGGKDVGLTDVEPAPPIVKSKPFNLNNFTQHVNVMHRDSDLQFSEEYKDVKEYSADPPTHEAVLDENRTKNRYTNILPFDHSRVKLLPIDCMQGSDYINANFMVGFGSQREFIAAQGPLPGTVDDFWRMLWEQNVPMIVMLTRLEERGREKCAQYWPNDNEAHFYGDLQVTMRSESHLDRYTIRIFDVFLGESRRSITQYHYTSWPDFGCPENTDGLLHLVRAVRADIRPDFKGPVVVHCSAGVGRTGTFICVDRLLQIMRAPSPVIDIYGLVLQMRQYRCHMVQSEDQYIYIHDCVKKAIELGLHLGVDNMAMDRDNFNYAEFNSDDEDEEENLYENAQYLAEHQASKTSKML